MSLNINFTEADMFILTQIIGEMNDALDSLESGLTGEATFCLGDAVEDAINWQEKLLERAGVTNEKEKSRKYAE